MSGCGGNCGCGSGSGCKCGNDCTGCKMYPEMTYAEGSSGQTLVMGIGVPERTGMAEEGVMGMAGPENGGKCKCGDNCTCNPCTCDK